MAKKVKNWAKWTTMESWTLAQAAFLVCGLEPPDPMREDSIELEGGRVKEVYDKSVAAVESGELATLDGPYARH